MKGCLKDTRIEACLLFSDNSRLALSVGTAATKNP